MTHKKTVKIVRRFLTKIQTWVNKTPGIVSVTVNINGRDIILAEKKSK